MDRLNELLAEREYLDKLIEECRRETAVSEECDYRKPCRNRNNWERPVRTYGENEYENYYKMGRDVYVPSVSVTVVNNVKTDNSVRTENHRTTNTDVNVAGGDSALNMLGGLLGKIFD